MPPLARLHMKAGFVWLAAGLLLLVAHSLGPWVPGGMALLAAHPTAVHFIVVGWLTQVVFAVGYWMFPKVSKERPRGREALARLAFYGLNAGLLLRGIAEPLLPEAPGHGLWAWALVLSGVLQLVAGLAWIVNTWPRLGAR